MRVYTHTNTHDTHTKMHIDTSPQPNTVGGDEGRKTQVRGQHRLHDKTEKRRMGWAKT